MSTQTKLLTILAIMGVLFIVWAVAAIALWMQGEMMRLGWLCMGFCLAYLVLLFLVRRIKTK